MPIQELPNVRRRAKLFAALADPTRLEIVGLLSDGEDLSTSQLAEHCGVSLALACHHVKVLAETGIVERKKVGLSVRYELRLEALEGAFNSVVRRAAAPSEQQMPSPLLRVLSAYPVA